MEKNAFEITKEYLKNEIENKKLSIDEIEVIKQTIEIIEKREIDPNKNWLYLIEKIEDGKTKWEKFLKTNEAQIDFRKIEDEGLKTYKISASYKEIRFWLINIDFFTNSGSWVFNSAENSEDEIKLKSPNECFVLLEKAITSDKMKKHIERVVENHKKNIAKNKKSI